MKCLARELLVVSTALTFIGCATIAPPQPPSLELPKPPADLRAVRKGDRVTLTWTVPPVTTDRQAVHNLGPTRICRGLDAKLTQCGTPVGEAAPSTLRAATAGASRRKQTATYIDTLPAGIGAQDPAAQITYAVEALSASGRSAGVSNSVRVFGVPTLPPPTLRARVIADGIVLGAEGLSHDAGGARITHLYRVYRRAEGSAASTDVLVQELKPEMDEVIDRNIEWEKTYLYRATSVSVLTRKYSCATAGTDIAAGFAECVDVLKIEGDDSPEVKVFAHDTFPPAVPSGLQAVFSGPGQKSFIDLIWAPVTDVDLDGYNVYRHEEGAAPVKVNAETVKTPAYRDVGVVAGKRYFYSVSAVDVRKNESARSEEAEESVP